MQEKKDAIDLRSSVMTEGFFFSLRKYCTTKTNKEMFMLFMFS